METWVYYLVVVLGCVFSFSAGASQYEVRAYCQDMSGARNFVQGIELYGGQSFYIEKDRPHIGTKEFYQYQLEKTCFRHDVYPWSKTTVDITAVRFNFQNSVS